MHEHIVDLTCEGASRNLDQTEDALTVVVVLCALVVVVVFVAAAPRLVMCAEVHETGNVV